MSKTQSRRRPISAVPPAAPAAAAPSAGWRGLLLGAPSAGSRGADLGLLAVRLVAGLSLALAPAPQVTRILLHGKEGEMLMPPVGGSMTDEQVAAVLTYVRRSWGNAATPISPAEVREARGSSGDRRKAWTEEELATIRR